MMKRFLDNIISARNPHFRNDDIFRHHDHWVIIAYYAKKYVGNSEMIRQFSFCCSSDDSNRSHIIFFF